LELRSRVVSIPCMLAENSNTRNGTENVQDTWSWAKRRTGRNVEGETVTGGGLCQRAMKKKKKMKQDHTPRKRKKWVVESELRGHSPRSRFTEATLFEKKERQCSTSGRG